MPVLPKWTGTGIFYFFLLFGTGHPKLVSGSQIQKDAETSHRRELSRTFGMTPLQQFVGKALKCFFAEIFHELSPFPSLI